MIKVFGLLCVFLPYTVNAQNSYSTKTLSGWSGWKINADAGLFGVLQKMTPTEEKRVGFCCELGVEYGFTFGKLDQFYFGGDIIFNLFFPDSFKKASLTLFGKNHQVYPVFFLSLIFYLGIT
jgi:hypothetical protein